jgi:hypothetical protein
MLRSRRDSSSLGAWQHPSPVLPDAPGSLDSYEPEVLRVQLAEGFEPDRRRLLLKIFSTGVCLLCSGRRRLFVARPDVGYAMTNAQGMVVT